MKTIVGVFSSINQAERALTDIMATGVPSDSTHLIAGNDKNRHNEYIEKSKRGSKSTGAAAASGASFGGGIGIVASLITLAIPGVGPIIYGGAMLTVLTGLAVGAAGGGLLGTFKNMGMSHEEAPLYEEAVRRGAVLAIAQVDNDKALDAVEVMNSHGGSDIRSEADTWRQSNWSGPSADPHPFVADDSVKSH